MQMYIYIYTYIYIHIYIYPMYMYYVKRNSSGKVAEPKRTQLKHFVPGPMQWLHNCKLARLCSEYICINMMLYIYICISYIYIYVFLSM